jgi:branched-chain amino acid transport system ATP-binding protein
MILETVRLTKVFKGLIAVNHLGFSMEQGELRCVIGPNGAGKSTFLKLIAGFLRPSSGRVLYRSQDITPLMPHERARHGIVTKFQVTNLFENLSVRENLRIPIQRRVLDRVSFLRRADREIDRGVDRVLTQVGLMEGQDQRASQLSHGERQWLEIGMVLATEPLVMLLDEPTAGMTIEETRATAQMLKKLAKSSGVTILIVEHDMHFVREIAERVSVMHVGQILTEGTVSEVEANEQVRKIYLGQA